MATNDDVPRWPEGKRFALCLTHDVDRVDKSWWHCIFYFLKTRRVYQLRSLFTKKRERPFWGFDRIMELEEKHGVRSTFFFLNETKKVEPLKPSTFGLAHGYYKIHDPRIVDIIKTLDSGGWEVGVHGSYDSYNNRELLAKEKVTLEGILGKPVRGIRQHFLNLDAPRTWEYQRDVGFEYDATFGFRDRADFRDGKDAPYYPLGDGFVEIPLAIMDGPLFKSSGGLEDAWKTCERLIGQAEKNGSLLTVLWHNNRFNEDEHPGQSVIYERIIEECQRRGAWVATGGDVYEWWKNR